MRGFTTLLIATALVAVLDAGAATRWFWRRGRRYSNYSRSPRDGSRGLSRQYSSDDFSRLIIAVRVKDGRGRTIFLRPVNYDVTRRVTGVYGNPTEDVRTSYEAPTTPAESYRKPKPTAKPTPKSTSYRYLPPATKSLDPIPAPPRNVQKLNISDRKVFSIPPVEDVKEGVFTDLALRPPPVKQDSVSQMTDAPPEGKEIEANLSGRIDGSVFFGIVPVDNDISRRREKTTPPPRTFVARRRGRCPVTAPSQCPEFPGRHPPACSNDTQCENSRLCCYDPCVLHNVCTAPAM